jgi:hypothetical protein
MADFYYRASQDERYKFLAMQAFKDAMMGRQENVTYQMAVDWMDSWIAVRQKRFFAPSINCKEMVDYLNKYMDRIPIFSSKLISPHTINTFTNGDKISV